MIGVSKIVRVLMLFVICAFPCNSAKSPGVCSDTEKNEVNVFVSYDVNSDVFSVLEEANKYTVAHARFSNCINTTGWSYLYLSTYNDYTLLQLNSSVQAYAAGLAEGVATRELIALHFHNTMSQFCQGDQLTTQCRGLKNFLQQNLDWVKQNVLKNPDNDYWYQVRLFYEQFRGLQDGFSGTPGRISMDIDNVLGLYLLSIQPETGDIMTAVSKPESSGPQFGHCSVLVKVIQGQDGVKDVLIAHDTWAGYNSMLRVLKRYDFYFRKLPTASVPVLGHSLTMSSYPGSLVSIDDFYVLSSAMVVTETTNPVYTPSLFSKVHPQSVLETVRVTVANRLAEHGSDWTSTFSQHNSGTYNNQWMVMDMKQFDEHSRVILPGFLTVLEQIPGYIHHEDVTSVLLNSTYWASYNIPYFQDVFRDSGLPDKVEEFGDYFSHDSCPRANIFRRDQGTVKDLSSLLTLMRYNDYQHDPLSKCNCTPPYTANAAISARGDLNPPDGSYPFPELGFHLGGGTDMKMTSLSAAMDTLTFVAISGPTFDPLPPFQWSKAFNQSSSPHMGHPDVFQFGPVIFNGTFGTL